MSEGILVNTSNVCNMEMRPNKEYVADVAKIESGETLATYFPQQENDKNINLASAVPNLCKEEPCLLGVDEAGRGPVLGPMVYGICYCPLSKADDLKEIGCADSKILTEHARETIFEKLCKGSDYIGWAIEAISPNMICNGMLRRVKHSLNQIAQDSTVGLIRRAVDSGANIREVYVDTVGPPEKYQERLSAIFPDLKFTVAKKADATYPIVSAASICAKVSRDRLLQTWIFPEGLDIPLDKIGSGYPSDPATKTFLAQGVDPVFGFPQLVRFSWSTSDKILQEKAAKVEWEDVDEEGNPPAKNTQITSFFTTAKAQKKKHAFFSKRNLESVSYL